SERGGNRSAGTRVRRDDSRHHTLVDTARASASSRAALPGTEGAASGTCRGESRSNVTQEPGKDESMLKVRPWSFATAATRLKPNPLPGVWRLFSNRWKRRNTASRSCAGIPGPLSDTTTPMRPFVLKVRTPTDPPIGLNLMALSTRLLIASNKRLGSPDI